MSAEITFSAGICVTGDFSFTSTRDQSKGTLKIIKEETFKITYKLAILYLGLNEQKQPRWKCRVNDQMIDVDFNGSNKLAFKATEDDSIAIEETDSNATCETWIDLSCKSYQ